MTEVQQNDSGPSQMQVNLQRGGMGSLLLHRVHPVVVVKCTLVKNDHPYHKAMLYEPSAAGL